MHLPKPFRDFAMPSAPAPFKIFQASAGAGKTYRLVQEYLKLCLAGERNSQSFMRILAITFTNKAAYEMKNRILEALLQLSDEKQAPNALFRHLQQELELEEDALRYRALRSLKSILHQFSAFSVSTIDSFTNRLIRSFSRDLKINYRYQIELDSERILKEALDRMLEKLERKSVSAEILTRYIGRQMESDRSPRIEWSLLKAAQRLLRENDQTQLHKLQSLQPEDYLRIESELRQAQKKYREDSKALAQNWLSQCRAWGLSADDMSGRNAWQKIEKLAQGEVESLSPTQVAQVLDAEKFGRKKDWETQQKIMAQATAYQQMGAQLVALNNLPRAHYFLRERILNELYNTASLSELRKELDQVKEESQRLPIGEFNQIISRYLSNQPAPFLFERLGARYRHFFVDEFQDTSRLQWQNLLPLINNSLAGADSSAMIVGDAKQAIYRWRGGDVQQFIDLYQDRDQSNQGPSGLALYQREQIGLRENWRSGTEIVDFNNGFFTHCAGKLTRPDHQDIYRQAQQEPRKSHGGYVQIDFLEPGDKDSHQQSQLEQCLSIIQDCRSRGYALNDICILTRKGEEGKAIAHFLVEKGWPVISPDNLKLNSSSLVQALISFFTLVHRPDDALGRLPWLNLLFERLSLPGDRHDFLRQHGRSALRTFTAFQEQVLPNWRFKDYQERSLTDKLYHLLQHLEIPFQKDPFLQKLLDEVAQFERNNLSSEAAFLEWWALKEEGLAVELPQGMEAVQIMTVHKAKGLQFPVVIFAFANLQMTMQKDLTLWVDLNPKDYFGLPCAMITMKDPGYYPENNFLHDWHQAKQAEVMLDQLNISYVALTRAVEENYLISTQAKGKTERLLGDYLRDYLSLSPETTQWTKGKRRHALAKKEPPTADPFPLEALKSGRFRDKLRVSNSAPRHWQEERSERHYGAKVHHLLAQLSQAKDLEALLNRECTSGTFKSDEKEKLTTSLQALVQHPELKTYFSNPQARVLNERPLLINQQTLRIPDRVLLQGKTAHILDYKTGAPQSKHRQQVDEYAKHYRQMGYQVGDRVLIYLSEPLKIDKNWT